MSATRYPLAWPPGSVRTRVGRRRAAFGTTRTQTSAANTSYRSKTPLTVSEATRRLMIELDRLGARDEILSTNLVVRLDGLPRSDQRTPEDPGVAVYFTVDRQPTVLACDKWDRVADNIAAVALHVEAMRGMDRWGVGSLAQAFRGYAALPAAADWRLVLGLEGEITPERIDARYHELARTLHPDAGGDPEAWTRLNEARAAAKKAVER